MPATLSRIPLMLARVGSSRRDQAALRAELAAERARNAALTAKAQARARLLAVLGRELQACGNGVAAFAEMLHDERASEPLGPRQARAVGQILERGRRLLALAEDVSEQAAGETGAQRPRPERLDPQHVIRRLAEDLTEQGRSARPRLRLPPMTPGLAVMADARILERVVGGLMEQAIGMAGPQGTVVVEIRQGIETEILFQAVGGDPGASETGDPFAPGGKLGLLRRMARRMGAEIRARPASGVGTALVLSLPAATPPASPPRPAFEPVSGAVLYVAGAACDRALMRYAAGALGAVGLYLAEDGEQGLALARDLRPDAIVIDLDAPGTDPVALKARLHADPFTRAVPALALVPAAPAPDLARRLRGAGFRHVLAKPLDIGDLASALRLALAAGDPPPDPGPHPGPAPCAARG